MSMSLFQALLYQEEVHMSGEQTWNIYSNLNHAYTSLCWSKMQRDLFNDGFGDLDEPTSIINYENWVDVEKYEQRWAKRVNVWRQRYYKAVKAFCSVKESPEADLMAINCCMKVEAMA